MAQRRPTSPPLGIVLASTSKVVSRAFDDALVEAGGSRPAWLVSMRRGVSAEDAAALTATLSKPRDNVSADGVSRSMPAPPRFEVLATRAQTGARVAA